METQLELVWETAKHVFDHILLAHTESQKSVKIDCKAGVRDSPHIIVDSYA